MFLFKFISFILLIINLSYLLFKINEKKNDLNSLINEKISSILSPFISVIFSSYILLSQDNIVFMSIITTLLFVLNIIPLYLKYMKKNDKKDEKSPSEDLNINYSPQFDKTTSINPDNLEHTLSKHDIYGDGDKESDIEVPIIPTFRVSNEINSKEYRFPLEFIHAFREMCLGDFVRDYNLRLKMFTKTNHIEYNFLVDVFDYMFIKQRKFPSTDIFKDKDKENFIDYITWNKEVLFIEDKYKSMKFKDLLFHFSFNETSFKNPKHTIKEVIDIITEDPSIRVLFSKITNFEKDFNFDRNTLIIGVFFNTLKVYIRNQASDDVKKTLNEIKRFYYADTHEKVEDNKEDDEDNEVASNEFTEKITEKVELRSEEEKNEEIDTEINTSFDKKDISIDLQESKNETLEKQTNENSNEDEVVLKADFSQIAFDFISSEEISKIEIKKFVDVYNAELNRLNRKKVKNPFYSDPSFELKVFNHFFGHHNLPSSIPLDMETKAEIINWLTWGRTYLTLNERYEIMTFGNLLNSDINLQNKTIKDDRGSFTWGLKDHIDRKKYSYRGKNLIYYATNGEIVHNSLQISFMVKIIYNVIELKLRKDSKILDNFHIYFANDYLKRYKRYLNHEYSETMFYRERIPHSDTNYENITTYSVKSYLDIMNSNIPLTHIVNRYNEYFMNKDGEHEVLNRSEMNSRLELFFRDTFLPYMEKDKYLSDREIKSIMNNKKRIATFANLFIKPFKPVKMSNSYSDLSLYNLLYRHIYGNEDVDIVKNVIDILLKYEDNKESSYIETLMDIFSIFNRGTKISPNAFPLHCNIYVNYLHQNIKDVKILAILDSLIKKYLDSQ